MKKGIIVAPIVAVCAAGVIGGFIAAHYAGQSKAEAGVADIAPDIVTELKVGKFYLEGGSDDQYIEVFDDHSICLYGYTPDQSTVALEDSERFTTRKYYWLNDKVPFIGLSETPGENTPGPGYSYTDENTINFTAVIDGQHVKQKYVYR